MSVTTILKTALKLEKKMKFQAVKIFTKILQTVTIIPSCLKTKIYFVVSVQYTKYFDNRYLTLIKFNFHVYDPLV